MSKRSLKLLIDDIGESIEKIERYTEGMSQESFQSIIKGYSPSIGRLRNSEGHFFNKKGYQAMA